MTACHPEPPELRGRVVGRERRRTARDPPPTENRFTREPVPNFDTLANGPPATLSFAHSAERVRDARTRSSNGTMTTTYDSSAIEVLTGLEPVRKRPGMYTQNERPNHLAQEVIDNSADEAIAGYADEITVTLHQDGSISVTDNGRGSPVAKHPQEGGSGA